MSMEQVTGTSAWNVFALNGAAALDPAPEFLESLPVAIYACDADGRLLWFNSRATELWGRVPRIGDGGELFCGSSKAYFEGREVSRDETPMASVLRTGIPVCGAESRVERPDGSFTWTTVDIEPIKDATSRILGAIACFDDITARRNAQEALARLSEEQTALHELTNRLQHATAPDVACDMAVAAILKALRCQRAAVLLFDDGGRMRFVAHRGLSESYRRAVDGHSPWTRDSRNAEPICMGDVEQAALPAELARAIRQEGIAALAFIPLQQDGVLLGKFMTYYDAPHAFTAGETEIATAIARQLAFNIERLGAQRAAQQFAAIVESSDDAIISKNLDGVIMTWNRGAERIFGYKADEVVGKPVTILMPPERRDEEPGILARIRRGERIDHYETVRLRKDGCLIDISLTVSPMRDISGRIIGASKIARDISDNKRAEAALRDSERRLQELLAAIPAAVYTTDAEGRITYYNEAAVEFAGRRPTLGSDEWCVTWKLYKPDGTPLPHEECPMAIALKEGRPIRNAEAVAERPDGSRVPFIPYPTPLRDADGNVVGAINMLVDVSERQQAETQQRVLLKELNHRVKNNMQMLQSLLNAATRRSQNAEARAVLGEASNRITAMAAAQRVLYDTPNATQFQIGEFLCAVCQTAQQTLPAGVKIGYAPAAGELTNDAAMPLALILNELIINAAKHGVNGRGEGAIRVGLTEDAGSFVLAVEDDGPGFDLAAVRERSSGLQLVQGLARQLRGTFEVTRGPTRCILRFS
jgi:PAS domain S-box-containing protein